MSSLARVMRAFVGAVGMTLRGEKPPTDHEKIAVSFPALSAWMRETIQLVEAIQSAIKESGIDAVTLTVIVDKRRTNAKTILETVLYHHTQEYQYMMINQLQHSLTGVYATNLNDRYAVLLLVQKEELPAKVRGAVERLRDHLDAIPSEA
jgi:hypothetical protein